MIDMDNWINDLFTPKPIQFSISAKDEFWRERRAIEACIQAAGIYGEEASMIEYEALRRLGIIEKSPCDV